MKASPNIFADDTVEAKHDSKVRKLLARFRDGNPSARYIEQQPGRLSALNTDCEFDFIHITARRQQMSAKVVRQSFKSPTPLRRYQRVPPEPRISFGSVRFGLQKEKRREERPMPTTVGRCHGLRVIARFTGYDTSQKKNKRRRNCEYLADFL